MALPLKDGTGSKGGKTRIHLPRGRTPRITEHSTTYTGHEGKGACREFTPEDPPARHRGEKGEEEEDALKATPSRKWAKYNDAATPEQTSQFTADTSLGCRVRGDLKVHFTAVSS